MLRGSLWMIWICQHKMLSQPCLPIVILMNCHASKLFVTFFYLPKCYLEVLKWLFESMLGGSSLPVLDFNESAHIELVSNNFQLSKMSKFPLQNISIRKWFWAETCAELCEYLIYIHGLFTYLNRTDMEKIGCFGFGLLIFDGVR